MTLPRALLAVIAIVAASAPSRAQLTEGEHDCQQAVVKQGASFLDKKIKCLVACDKRSLKGKATDAECTPPYAGKTLECVSKVEQKAIGAIVKACDPDCPRCYANGNCSAFAASLIGTAEAEVDSVAPVVRCDDSGSADGLTKSEAMVREKVAITISKFVVSTEKCLAKCRKGQADGKIPPGACSYGSETDTKTIDCLIKAGGKALDYVEDPGLDAPECLEPNLTFALPQVSGLLEELDPVLFCGSPSGAFVD
jgi:hypothetical protein